jgi:transcriptional regulator with GAF, ATPase, and Fis domain
LVANLHESELFGHVKGAFTSAERPRVGKFEAAGNGTVLLDEIETLGLEQQVNLLRVIETSEYEPVGSNQTQTCTARIIAASNCNLEEAVQQGRFRKDLYYRLNVMSFYLPPLRDRVQDIGPLARPHGGMLRPEIQQRVVHRQSRGADHAGSLSLAG